MVSKVTIRPGEMRLADWQAIYSGADVELDAGSRSNVERAAATVASFIARSEPVYGINTGFGKLAQTRIRSEDLAVLQRNLILSHAAGVGTPLPRQVVRLVLALKIASLARGYSGVRWQLVEQLADFLRRDLLPILPAQGSVGASGDLAPLAHLGLALIGEGRVMLAGTEMPAAAALAKAGLRPIELAPKEGLALINGTQVSTALALAGFLAMERVFIAALIAGAMTLDAIEASDTPYDARIHLLRGHSAQQQVAAALRELAAGSSIRESHRGCAKVQDPYSLRCQPQVMGAILTLIHQAGHTLVIEANSVSDNPLVFPADNEVLSGGNFHAEPVAFAADLLALGLAEIGNLSERRTALLMDPVMSGLPAFLAPDPGLNSGFMIAQVTAAALAAENKQRAQPAAIDTIPTSANQEDHVSMATHGARRLLDMAENAASIVAIEILAAAQGLDFRRPLPSSPPVERAHALLRAPVPRLETDRCLAPDIAAAAELVRSGALAQATGVAFDSILSPVGLAR